MAYSAHESVDGHHRLLQRLHEIFTTVRPTTLPLRKLSNTDGSSWKSITTTCSCVRVGFHSRESRSQMACLSSMGVFAELVPSNWTPRRMSGITVVFSLKSAARPMLETVPS